MTIGPAPMIRMECDVGALGHQARPSIMRDEALEQIVAVGRARARLGVVLHREHRPARRRRCPRWSRRTG